MAAIFISHSRLDASEADDIKASLARLGFERVFLDFDKATGVGAGENWEKRLYEELSRCHAVILVLTPNWLASKWCFAELTQARALDHSSDHLQAHGRAARSARHPGCRSTRLEQGRLGEAGTPTARDH